MKKKTLTIKAVILVVLLFGLFPSCKGDGLSNRIPANPNITEKLNKQLKELANKQDSLISGYNRLIELKNEEVIRSFENGYLKGVLDGAQGKYNSMEYRIAEFKIMLGKNSE